MRILLITLLISNYCFGQNCDIVIKRDKFTEETTIHSQFSKGFRASPFTFYKSIKGGDTTYALSAYIAGSSYSVSPKGVYIIFEDGTKWAKPDETLEVSYIAGSSYAYFAYMELSEEDIEKLRTTRITDYKLHYYDRTIKKSDADYLICGVGKVLKAF